MKEMKEKVMHVSFIPSLAKHKGSIPEDTIAHRPLATLVRAAEDAKGKVFAIAVERTAMANRSRLRY
jgi:hypothetical protein